MYSRKLGDRILSFGHEGVLFKRSFIMYDKETESLWLHTTGQAVKGKLKGSQLEFVPSQVMPWAAWRALHPDTKVLTGRRSNGFMGKYVLRERRKEFGWSLGQGNATKLYPYAALAKVLFIEDTFGGEKVVIHLDRKTLSVTAFKRGKLSFVVKDGVIKDKQGRTWDLVRGTSGDAKLESIAVTSWLVKRWRGFYPKGEVYGAARR